MQKISLILLMSFYQFILPGPLEAALLFRSTVNSESLKKTEPNNEAKKPLAKAQPPQISMEKNTDSLDEQAIRDSLKKYEIILSREKKIENIIALEFNRIVCFMNLARLTRIKSGGKNLVAEEEQYLKKSLALIDKIFKQTGITSELKAQLLFFQGMSYLDLGLKEKSRDSFEKAVELNHDSKFVPSLSLYLADLYYDDGDLNKALTAYKRFYLKMNPGEQDLANYKIAWIFLNQSKIEESINTFTMLVKKSNSKSIVQDSVLSLSVALSERYTEDVVLGILDKAQLPAEQNLKILWGVYENFLKVPAKPRLKIWLNILNSENQDSEIIKLVSSELQYIRLEDQKEKELQQLLSLQQYFIKNSGKINKFSDALLTSLGQDLERVISTSLEKYQKNSDVVSYKILRVSIDCYLKLNAFGRQLEVATLLIELLNDSKHDEDLINFCKDILKDPQYSSLRDKAKLIILINYEKKFIAAPKAHQATFFSLAKVYLANSEAEQWESVSAKYYEYLVKANLFYDAENVMTVLYAKLPKDDYFFKLVTIKFENKKCSDIINLLKGKESLDKKVLDYRRECNLTLAQDFKKNPASLDLYKQNILEFIKQSEGSKKRAGIADFLASFKSGVNKDASKDYYAYLDSEFYQYRFTPEIFPFYQKEIVSALEGGDFGKARFYLKNCEQSEGCDIFKNIAKNLNAAALLDTSANNELHESVVSNPEMLKYLSLIKPEIFLRESEKGSLPKITDPALTLISIRLAKMDWSNPEIKNFYKKFESQLSKEERTYVYSPAWEQFGKIKFPSDPSKIRDQEILQLMKKVQNTRKIVLTELSKYSTEGQKNILLKGVEVENKMADFVKMSPIPKALDPAQKNDYLKGLQELAEEFSTQSKSYEKSLESLSQQAAQKNVSVEVDYSLLVSPAMPSQWDWGPKSVYTEKLIVLVSKGHFTQSLFYQDYLFTNLKITPKEYYAGRSGVLLLSAVVRKKSAPMIKYVWNECELNKQVEILGAWKDRSNKK